MHFRQDKLRYYHLKIDKRRDKHSHALLSTATVLHEMKQQERKTAGEKPADMLWR